MNHDDVIGTRAVSFIIYLTDPDEPWRAEEGGALELYPLVEGEGDNAPVTRLHCYTASHKVRCRGQCVTRSGDTLY